MKRKIKKTLDEVAIDKIENKIKNLSSDEQEHLNCCLCRDFICADARKDLTRARQALMDVLEVKTRRLQDRVNSCYIWFYKYSNTISDKSKENEDGFKMEDSDVFLKFLPNLLRFNAPYQPEYNNELKVRQERANELSKELYSMKKNCTMDFYYKAGIKITSISKEIKQIRISVKKHAGRQHYHSRLICLDANISGVDAMLRFNNSNK